jgi:hypothetical protein
MIGWGISSNDLGVTPNVPSRSTSVSVMART